MLDRINSKFLWNLDWNLLKIFSAIVEYGGVSRAAKAIHRRQPSVSTALKHLEEHLGVTLCKRGPSGFELTDEGKLLAEICLNVEAMLSSVPGGLDEITSEVIFQIRLVVVSNLVSPRLDSAIAEFGRLYPRAELLVNVAPCTEIESRVLSNEAEIGISPVADTDSPLDLKFLYQEQHGIVCANDHPLCKKEIDYPADLAKEPFILLGSDEADQVVRYREKFGLGKIVNGESPDLNEVRRMVIAGMGIALMPLEFLADDLRSGRLYLLTPAGEEVKDDVFLMSNSAGLRVKAVAKFLELIPD